MKLTDYLLEDDQRIGKEIFAQIKAKDKWAMASWGIKNPTLRPDGVQFDVRGSKFKGRMVITYDRGADLYNIEIGNIKNLEWKSKKTVHGIFTDDLVSTIDGIIG